MATIELANLGFQLTPLPTISPFKSRTCRSRLQFRNGFGPSVNRRAASIRPPSCSLVDEQQKQGTEVVSLFNEQENSLIEALIGIQGRGRSASAQQLQEVERAVQILEGSEGVPDPTSSSLIEGRWQLMFTTRPGTASLIQRTFVGVDIFSVFQEVYLRTNDPRVSNIVRFSDAIGELKVEVPYPVPFRLLGDEAKGWLDTTYLSRSGNLRISRGNKAIDEFISLNKNAAKDEPELLEGEWKMIWSSQEETDSWLENAGNGLMGMQIVKPNGKLKFLVDMVLGVKFSMDGTFVPIWTSSRTGKQVQAGVAIMEGNQRESSTVAENGNEAPDAVADVKKRCWDQREALPGEPHCVICGRYGEYICDETDDDICSLECKQTLLRRVARSQAPVALPPPTRLPTPDECFYVRDNDEKFNSQSLTNDQTELLRTKLKINVRGDLVPAPVLSFNSCNLPQKLLDNIEVAGYEMPTPVQMQAIPAALVGKSLLVSADTGSGKTASFLVPVIASCSNLNHEKFSNQKKPLSIVLTPTRELCIQVEEQAKLLAKGLPFKTALVVGGDPMAGQLHRINQGVGVIIATPGRLIDLLTKHDIELDNVSVLVLDEVDLMLQRGFHEQVIQIFQALSQPQVLMYSATISKEVEKMACSMVKGITVVSVGKPNKPNRAVKQMPIWVESKKKKQKLFDILLSKQHFMPPVVIFVGSRLGADLLSEAVAVTTGIKALSIHGEKPMKERREIIRSFLVGEVPVLVATGVLGRGIDLLGVRQVIVFDMPISIKEYVHQIGRASRLGEEGTAIVFVNEENKKIFPELVDILKSSGAPIPRELNSRYTKTTFPLGKGQKKRKHSS
ncbi:hypothetical protein RHMOL_Rhmol13G0298000 [Rhododendron molle]|uniref:Uncharacterized protein n=1 Tax=Rhododendron molle TaxID=49168 RepID=A0ACC0LDU0_RHOML|nr:hypothetical protein RHMOL_Rhmol13G0298000 [Rhododendron molle]